MLSWVSNIVSYPPTTTYHQDTSPMTTPETVTVVKPETITIDGTQYVRADSIPTRNDPPHDSEVRIVVLQRGWVVVGRFTQDGTQVKLSDAHVIERWGTTEGIGQLVNGPTSQTRLRRVGSAETHELGVVLSIAADPEAWKAHL